jgi:hypothetical protein
MNHSLLTNRRAAALLVVSLSVLVLLPLTVHAEQVTSFSAAVNIASDASVQVVETINYDFGSEERHGITRDLPTKYTRNGSHYNLRLSVQSVTGAGTDPVPYQQTRTVGGIQLRIGDANQYVSGQQTYVITYDVQRAINFFPDHDEFYWNITGNSTEVPILAASAIVQSPSGASLPTVTRDCYTGLAGSADQQCSITESGTTLEVRSSELLNVNEGLTIVLGYPVGTIQRPTTTQQVASFLADNWGILLPVVFLIGMIFLWVTRGRDPRYAAPLIPEYEPPDGRTAGELGVLLDERADLTDVSASFIQLAVKGYLKIRELGDGTERSGKRSYEFHKLKEPDGTLAEHEQLLMSGIFDATPVRTLTSLQNTFYIHLPKIKAALYREVVHVGYFAVNPENVRKMYAMFSVLVILVGGMELFIGGSAATGAATIVGGFLSFFISRYMPRRTLQGVRSLKSLVGFRWFLSVTEKQRLAFHQAPNRSPKEFEQFLPYAMVLGVEKQWAAQFTSVYLTPPNWYEGSHGAAFGAWYLASSLGSMSHSMGTAMVSTPHVSSAAGGGHSGFSSGGGFSGGGFGGGGVGSW